MLFTGNKNVDLKILSELNDIDLANICKVNVTAKKYCNDENFWLNRTLKKFGQLGDVEQLKEYKGNKTWKEYYIHLVNFIENYYENSSFADRRFYLRNKDLRELKDIIYNNTLDFLNSENSENKISDFEPHFFEKKYNNLIRLSTVFEESLDNNNINEIFKILLKNPNFKTNNPDVLDTIFSHDNNTDFLDELFNNENRLSQIKTRKGLFTQLFSGRLDLDLTKQYLGLLFPHMTTKEILDDIVYAITTVSLIPSRSIITYIFSELVKRGLSKYDLEVLYYQLKHLQIDSNERPDIENSLLVLKIIKEYIEDLPNIENPQMIPEIIKKLQENKYSPKTIRKVLRILSK